MSAYRKVILAVTMFAVLLAASVPILKDTGAAAVISGVVTLEAIFDIIATIYIATLVMADRRRPRSWLLLMLFTTSLLVTLGVVPIAVVVVLRFLGFPPLANGVGLLLVGVGLALLAAVPVMKAVLFVLVSRDPTARNDVTGEQ